MFIFTTIASDNDAVHLIGHTEPDPEGDGYRYQKCTIIFWSLSKEPYRTEEDKMEYILDNEIEIVTKILPQLEKFCDIDKFKDFELTNLLSEALGVSLVDPYELRDIIIKAIELGILYDYRDSNSLNEINSFFD